MAPVDQRKSSRAQQSYLSSFIRWLQLKNYQYEVTFSLYMLTATEKCIFNLILFVLVSMLVTAATMYLPNHVALIYNRIWYYVHGELANITGAASSEILKGADGAMAVTVTKNVVETASNILRQRGEL